MCNTLCLKSYNYCPLSAYSPCIYPSVFLSASYLSLYILAHLSFAQLLGSRSHLHPLQEFICLRLSCNSRSNLRIWLIFIPQIPRSPRLCASSTRCLAALLFAYVKKLPVIREFGASQACKTRFRVHGLL